MHAAAKSENIPSPKDFHRSYYWKTLNSRIWWAIFYSGFVFVGADGLVRALHLNKTLFALTPVVAVPVFIVLFTGIGSYLRSSEQYRKLTADKNQMPLIVGRTARWFHIGMLAIKFPRNIVLGLFGAFIAGMVCNMINTSSDTSMTAAIAATILFPTWITYRSTAKTIRALNTAFIEMPAQIAAVLEKVDYFYLGIGVDVANKMLASNSLDKKYRISEPFKFGLNKIINYHAFAPGHTEISGVGLNGTQQYQVEMQNLSAQMKAKNKTGLYIDIDDVHQPRVFVEMTLEQAESWVLLLNKLRRGALKKQDAPMLYPYPPQPQ